MAVIYCGKSNKTPYYIREADIKVYSIKELAYFIYEYPMLLSNSFISKPLILYISKELELPKLASVINDMYNKNTNIADILTYILANSNYYNDSEIVLFRKNLLSLFEYSEAQYINMAGDKLFALKKYERAINQYNKIARTDNMALLKMAFCYAKLQFYENAAMLLKELYEKTKNKEILKEAYYCLYLNGSRDRIYEFEEHIDEKDIVEWEFSIVSEIIKVRASDEIKEKSEIFLMGTQRIKECAVDLIKMWKEKYRYIG